MLRRRVKAVPVAFQSRRSENKRAPDIRRSYIFKKGPDNMANYRAVIRTNYFTVNDETKFRETVASCNAEDELHIFETTKPDGSKAFGFGCYGSIYGIPPGETEDDDESNLDAFYDALQAILPEDEAIIVTEIGNEKLRYLIGNCTVITHNDIQFVDVRDRAIGLAKTMLKNSDFQTQSDY
jgi:hypothetical protein